MEEDAPVISSGQVITPETVSNESFTSVFRGYHPAEVRQFLKRVGDELAASAGREVELRRALQDALNRAAHPELDETIVTTVLGEHAARLISSARETASSITGDATTRADAVLRDADGRVARMREEAEGLLARRLAEADAATAVVRQEAQAEAQRLIEEATQRGKEMVAEARDVRERMLADLARRRRAGQAQVEQLRAARDRLLAAYDVVRRTVDEATGELEAAEPEARAAAEAVRLVDEALAPARRPAAASVAVGAPLALAGTPARRDRAVPPAVPPGASLLRRVAEPAAIPAVAPERPAMRPQTVAGAVARQQPPPAPPVAPIPSAPEPSDLTTGDVPAVAADPAPAPAPAPAANGNGNGNGSGHANGNGNGHGDASPGKTVDALFARIRADRAQPAPPEPEPPVDIAPAPVATPDPIVTENALSHRDELLEDVEAGLTRALKRILQDEQNEVLDRLRRAGSVPAGAALPPADDHRNRYRGAALPWLRQAARAGTGFAGGSEVKGDPPLDDQANALAAELVEPLRERLERALEADDAAAAGESLRAVYRQWKVQHVEVAARHHVMTAFNVGAFDATSAGAQVQWLVDDDGHCPDCDDNALAGATAKGQPFPTGQLHPPAHPGCRCVLVPAQA